MVLAVAYMTVFGVKVASGSAPALGFVEASSLPLVAVGVFAVWALALTHVVQAEPKQDNKASDKLGASRVGSLCGYAAVIALHGVFAIVLMITEHHEIGVAVLALGTLLATCLLIRTKATRTVSGSAVTAQPSMPLR